MPWAASSEKRNRTSTESSDVIYRHPQDIEERNVLLEKGSIPKRHEREVQIGGEKSLLFEQTAYSLTCFLQSASDLGRVALTEGLGVLDSVLNLCYELTLSAPCVLSMPFAINELRVTNRSVGIPMKSISIGIILERVIAIIPES